ncbi:MAG: hypothetical protein CO092_03920 [Candidatus Aenigmarchaeota archaeon CG_4_9_14_3_um_filter_37_18]|nr:hypothetical protein [Candidatus Aenigmarchaeota archaeon]OIN88569.1 MAG: hypothetical protein AUJ50_00500 [Candidatus Aenigmarchaeota archaeon CG1_02_38_14]PJB74729.1 MAG: hypothetical protein CO092_03920 [Candidatus Aenigmarchaeota archaeon CG_4_9_14_3_um_filter_37_18]
MKIKGLSLLLGLMILAPSFVLAAPPPCLGAAGPAVMSCTISDVFAAVAGGISGGYTWGDVSKVFFKSFIGPIFGQNISLPAALSGTVIILGIAVPYIIYLTLIAFAAIWMISYGFLKELRIFRRSRNLYPWIALLIALATIPTQIFGSIVILMLRFMGQWSVIIFGLTFFLGMWRYMQVFNRGMSSRAAMAGLEADRLSSLKKDLADLRRARSDLFEELTEPGINAKKQAQISGQIDNLDKSIKSLLAQIGQAEESAST